MDEFLKGCFCYLFFSVFLPWKQFGNSYFARLIFSGLTMLTVSI